jgi:hypothetical protein
MLRALFFFTVCLFYTYRVSCINIDVEVDSISCYGGHDGKIMVNISEINSLYTIRLMEEKNNRLIKHIDLFADTITSFTNLENGKYILQLIYDGKSEEKVIKISQPTKLEGNIIIEKYPNPKETCNGIIFLEPSGGKKPYKYKWNEGGEGLNKLKLTNLCEKIYSCELIDANGCRSVVSTTFLYKDEISEEKK